jgi:hypothetical protein
MIAEQYSDEHGGGGVDKVTISHRGERYEIGLGKRQYAIWAVDAPRDEPVDRWPETAEGWSQAWARFTTIETPGTIAAVPRARSFKIPGLKPGGGGAPPGPPLPVVAAGLLALGVAAGVAGLFPDYFTATSLASQAQLLVPHVLYLAAWAVAAAGIARGGTARAGMTRAAALLGTGLAAVTFGLYVADLGTGTSAHAGVGAGMVVTLIGWVACAAGSALGLRIQTEAEAEAGGKAGRKVRRADAGPVLLLALCALGAAVTFIPSWDSYTLTQATTGNSQTVTAGNAFSERGWVLFGDIAAVAGLFAVAIPAAAWRPAKHGAALLGGAIVAMAAQAISALIQVSQPATPAIFGISAAQAKANGLTASSSVTSIFWVYGLFVIALGISCAWLLTTPAQPVASNPAQPYPAGEPPANYADSLAEPSAVAPEDREHPVTTVPAKDEAAEGGAGEGSAPKVNEGTEGIS